MKVRYCKTELQRIIPCSVKYSYCSGEGVCKCIDNPKEKYCSNIIDDGDIDKILEGARKHD